MITHERLQSVAALAYLDIQTGNEEALAEEVSAIIDFAEQLSRTDTSRVAPLFHPLDLHQPLRADAVTEADCLQELAELAPHFDELYLVPKVIEREEKA